MPTTSPSTRNFGWRAGLVRSIWLILALGCSTEVVTNGDDSGFFPTQAFKLKSDEGDISNLLADRFSDALRRMNEPSLWNASRRRTGVTAYRLLQLDTEKRPVSIRVEKTGDRMTLKRITLDGSGGYELGKIADEKQVTLIRKDWDRLTSQVRASGFWKMPTRVDRLGLDGQELIIEGVEDGRYHVVDRWTPEAGAFRELCDTLFDLSNIGPAQEGKPN